MASRARAKRLQRRGCSASAEPQAAGVSFLGGMPQKLLRPTCPLQLQLQHRLDRRQRRCCCWILQHRRISRTQLRPTKTRPPRLVQLLMGSQRCRAQHMPCHHPTRTFQAALPPCSLQQRPRMHRPPQRRCQHCTLTDLYASLIDSCCLCRCPQCGRMLLTRRALQQHLRAVHAPRSHR